MKSINKIKLLIFIILVTTISCSISDQKNKKDLSTNEYQEIIKNDYEISKPTKGGNTTLILFGGFPENASDIKRKFHFLEKAKQHQMTILYMNYNRKLWMTKEEKNEMTKRLNSIFSSNNLPTENIHIGGFSSGGNITLLLSNHLISAKSEVQPKGIFIVDSPVDLLELYKVADRNLERNFSETSVQEAKWLKNLFNNELGLPENGIAKYKEYSPFTSETNHMSNLTYLDGLKIRFYSEPDTLWWKENRNYDPIDLNAHWIEKLVNELKINLPNSQVEYITTSNKGYRENGERHPHSWSIIDKDDLLNWMLKNANDVQ
ncbi:hypothetical protein [Flammeovirga pacifica]|uniref:Alpha/beta hydrolase fold-3 domain-containing protein n=1 Tax=Flammeovirga pacifica TaxID=915059 RepID=A0A1S1YU44_FLAPC|nr:hypothetical protein [Flammeovirga pacifica]OHX64552.1 hypothetical protein NH26_23555 [Flammeovirga pacifica]